MPKWLKGCLIIVMIPACLAVYLILPWLGMGVFAGFTYLFGTNPPEPEIREGEFPFQIVYEINGEKIIVNDVYVCEFDGFGLKNGGFEKVRKWKGYIKSSGDEFLYVTEDTLRKVYIDVGSSEYYMDDAIHPYHKQLPRAKLFDAPKEKNTLESGYEPYEEGEIASFFGIKIIDYKFSSPIVNTFE